MRRGSVGCSFTGVAGVGHHAPDRRRDPRDVRDGAGGWPRALALRRSARLVGDGAAVVSGRARCLGATRGQDQLAYALEDVLRGVSLGLRGVLVADAGLLWVLRDLKAKGELPEDLVVKVSVQLSAANAAALKAMEDLGADTYNVPTDLASPSSPRYGRRRRPARRLRRGPRRLRRLRQALRGARPRAWRCTRVRQGGPEERAQHLPIRWTPGGDRGGARRERVRRARDRLSMLERYYPGAKTTERAQLPRHTRRQRAR